MSIGANEHLGRGYLKEVVSTTDKVRPRSQTRLLTYCSIATIAILIALQSRQIGQASTCIEPTQ